MTMDCTSSVFFSHTPLVDISNPILGSYRSPADDNDNRKKRPKLDGSFSTAGLSQNSCRIPTACDSTHINSRSIKFLNCLPPLPATRSDCMQEANCSDQMDVDGAVETPSCSGSHGKRFTQSDTLMSPSEFMHHRMRLGYVDEVDLKLEHLFTKYKLQQQLPQKPRYQPREAAIAEDDDVIIQVSRASLTCHTPHLSTITFANCLPPLASGSPPRCY